MSKKVLWFGKNPKQGVCIHISVQGSEGLLGKRQGAWREAGFPALASL